MMKFQLNEEQRAMVRAVREVAQEEFKPRVSRWQDGTFPWDNMRTLAKMGILGMAVPQEYGGSEMSIFDTALVVEEISKVCYVTAMALMGELGVQTRIITHFAPERLRREILPSVVSGDSILAVCMTEPHAGTDVANFRTNCTIQGNKAILKGVKTLISRVGDARWYVVFSRIDNRPGRDGIGCVLIDKDTPGFEITARYHTMGGENLAEIRFNDCELPVDHVAIQEGGFRKLLNAFNTQRCLNPSVSLGLAEGAFEEAIKYARDRTVFGRSITDYQGMQWKLAEMYRDIEVGRSILYRACMTADPFPDPHLAAIAKMYNNEMAIRITSDAIQFHGGYGFTDEYPVSRLYRGARYGTLGGGTTETLKELVAKRLMADFDPVDGFLGMKSFF